jgi:glycosyltransferase involved in cell wall biosynthesis
VILVYIKRILMALSLDLDICFNKSENIVIYSSSDFLPDVLPSYWFKRKYGKAKWVQLIHHLYKNPFKRIGNGLFTNLFGYSFQKLSFFFIKNYADTVIVVNSLVKEELIRLGFNDAKIKIIPNGVNISYLNNIKKSEIVYDAIFMARFNKSKGIFDLIDIWKLVVSKKPNAKLAIIGGGDDKLRKELLAKINGQNLNKNIDILGYLGNHEAYSLIKASKVFVFPSHEEGFGISILEAMCCGVPVIAWDLPVYSKIFYKGLIQVKENRFDEFSNVVISLLSDESRYNKIKKDALDLSARYSWDKAANMEMYLLKNLI